MQIRFVCPNNMQVLYVHSDDDYAALNFEEKMNVDGAVKQLTDSGKKSILYKDDDCTFTVDLLEFGEIDPKFIQFLQSEILDYDASKHNNFYIVP